MLIRPDRKADHAAIHKLTFNAFAPMAFADGGITYRDHTANLVRWKSFGGSQQSGEIRFAAGLEPE